MENGDVFKAQRKPLIYHYGVYFKDSDGIEKIIHSTDSKNIVIETLDYFLSDRKVISIFKTNISGCSLEYIYEQYELLKNKKYDLLSYDCEDFVSEFTKTKIIFKQKKKYVLSGVILLILSYSILNKGKN